MVQRCLIVSDCVVGAWGLSGLGSIIVQMLGRQPYFSSLKVYLYLVPWIPRGAVSGIPCVRRVEIQTPMLNRSG